jgi:hypothetical protein
MSHRFRWIQKFHSDGIETHWRLRFQLVDHGLRSIWIITNHDIRLAGDGTPARSLAE